MMDSILHAKSYTSVTAVTTINLREIGTPGGFAGSDALLVFDTADFDIEVVGNDDAVTMQAKGPFGSSIPLAVSDSTFAIGGGKLKLNDFAVAEFVFTRVGTDLININIVRKIRK